MEKISQNAVYLVKSKSEEFLALCNLEDFFVDGDYVKLIQLFREKICNEDMLCGFSKIDFAIYNEETKDLKPLTQKYHIVECLGELSEVIEHVYNTAKPVKTNLNMKTIKEFLESMMSPALN